MVKITKELDIENNLINILTREVSQWTYEPEIKDEASLWENFRRILERNNKNVLSGIPLSDREFEQIKSKIDFPSFFQAGAWLAGANGEVKVDLVRDDSKLGHVRLLVFDRRAKSGGTSVYQVINQYQSPYVGSGGYSDARFDVTLLFNGLPLIHIELKKPGISYKEAFNQIQYYINRGHFRGLYSCVQTFVVSNRTDTRYIAAGQQLQTDFLNRWSDQNNKRVGDLYEFANQALKIPRSHELVTDYTVLDYNREKLMALRPYQIHAIKSVEKATKNNESGFVWHTTGSGKTLTSYKVARNLMLSPSLDKSIFIVDRVDLDQQTTSAFLSYSKGDVVSIDESQNVNHLYQNLLSGDRSLVITTIQKLLPIIREMKENPNSSRSKKLRELKLVFVVDECHRAISPEKHREIKQEFPRSLWYGFTGTPIFTENARKEQGNLPRTTETQYGRCLHQYTVKEAIGGESVLKFLVEYHQTLNRHDLSQAIEGGINPAMSDIEVESRAGDQVYLEKGHMEEVVDYITNKTYLKFNLDDGSPSKYLNGMLTVSSIEQAQKYYKLFKEVEVSDEVRKKQSDFPKVAITYSLQGNEESSEVNYQEMAEALEDYNAMYETDFNLSTIKAYNINLNERLARKKDKYWRRSEQVDLVIVVDRLLTGFDAPSLGTLFVDRPPMTKQSIMQAFSRTNRIFGRHKEHGNVVIFQKPNTFKQRIDETFALYSNGGEDIIQAPEWKEVLEEFRAALNAFFGIAPSPGDVLEYRDLGEKLTYVKAFQALDRSLRSVRTYSEFTRKEDYGLSDESLEDYYGHYVNLKEELKNTGGESLDEQIDLVLNYELTFLKQDQIDHRYITLLIQSNVPEGNEESGPFRNDKEIVELIKKLKETRPEIADVLRKLYEEVKHNQNQFRDMDIHQQLLDRLDQIRYEKAKELADHWQVDAKAVIRISERHPLYMKGFLNHEFDPDRYRAKHGVKTRNRILKQELRKEMDHFHEEVYKPYSIDTE